MGKWIDDQSPVLIYIVYPKKIWQNHLQFEFQDGNIFKLVCHTNRLDREITKLK